MEVVATISEFIKWVKDMAKNSTEAVREWTKKNPERRKEQNRKAAARYAEKNKDNPEYIKRRHEIDNRSKKKAYYAKRASMTEEELEEYRRVTRERVAAIRAKKKAERLAQQAAEAANTDNTDKGTD